MCLISCDREWRQEGCVYLNNRPPTDDLSPQPTTSRPNRRPLAPIDDLLPQWLNDRQSFRCGTQAIFDEAAKVAFSAAFGVVDLHF